MSVCLWITLLQSCFKLSFRFPSALCQLISLSLLALSNNRRSLKTLYCFVKMSSLRLKCVWQGITPIWYLYAMASVQLLQVINTSFNFPIYWFVGNFRETFMAIFCTWGKKELGDRRDQGKVLFLHQIKIYNVWLFFSSEPVGYKTEHFIHFQWKHKAKFHFQRSEKEDKCGPH